MPASSDAKQVASALLARHSLELLSCRQIQSLWAGYGSICEVKARATTRDAASRMRKLCGSDDEDTFALILKLITPPSHNLDARDEGHLRKMLSYDVEQYFYSVIVPRLDNAVAVARCVASTIESPDGADTGLSKGITATIMTDLRPAFPVAGEKRATLNDRQVFSALDWLSGFHRQSRNWIPSLDQLVRAPIEELVRRNAGSGRGDQVWLNGGYTYLATRRTEFSRLAGDASSEWRDALCSPVRKGRCIAELVADFLTPTGRDFESYIHGDVKSENLFATTVGDQVAFFDFQYVGLGLGVCDLAKLFTCSVPLGMLTASGDMPDQLPMGKGERALLERYRLGLVDGQGHGIRLDWTEFTRHWEAALVDWHRFQVSWGQWGNSDWLQARVWQILNDVEWREWLLQSVGR